MANEQRPGQQDAVRAKGGTADTDQLPKDRSDAEGHVARFGRATPDTDKPPSDETEDPNDDTEGNRLKGY